MILHISRVGLALLWSALLLPSSAHAQSDEIGDTISTPPTISARAATGTAPVMDGDVPRFVDLVHELEVPAIVPDTGEDSGKA